MADQRAYYKVVKIKEKKDRAFIVYYVESHHTPIKGALDIILSIKPEMVENFSNICEDQYLYLYDGTGNYFPSMSHMQKQLWKFPQGDTSQIIRKGCSYPFLLKNMSTCPIGKVWFWFHISNQCETAWKNPWDEIFKEIHDGGQVYISLNSYGRYMIGPELIQLDIHQSAPDSVRVLQNYE